MSEWTNPLAAAVRDDHPLATAEADGIVGNRHIVGASLLMELAHGPDAVCRSVDEWLLVALALSSPEGEHSCIDLGDVGRHAPDGFDSPCAARLRLGLDHWRSVAAGMDGLVGRPGAAESTPLVLDGHRLYLARMQVDECFVADDLLRRGQRLKVLLGGPGSGKTTKTAEDLLELLGDAPEGFAVGLAAPTGKAAMRMRTVLVERVRSAAEALGSDPERVARAERALAATDSVTVHRLLGYSRQRERGRYRFDETRRLPYDLVIVDECSMLSLEMLTNLLRAVREDATLWIVGDPDQLASVGAGTVLADVRSAASTSSHLGGQVTVLEQLHRFKDPTVRSLVESVRDAASSDRAGVDAAAGRFFDLLSSGSDSVTWVDPVADPGAVDRIVHDQIADARNVARLAVSDDAEGAIGRLLAGPRTHVLCVHRAGRLGVAGINDRIRAALGPSANGLWYPGRPVMVTRNDQRTGVFNGDTGVVVRRPDGSQVVVLSEPVGRPPVPVSRVDHHELAYAMTVHKSQGSEFSHVVAIVPTEPSGLCTREMLYTAISRTVERLTLVATREVLEHMLRTPISRATGLADRFGE